MTRTKPVKSRYDMDHYHVVERGGHHKPNGQRFRPCGCSAETDGGYAYRDMVLESFDHTEGWNRIRFYHQSPVVKKKKGIVRVNTFGYGHSQTTRDRINKELPAGFRITQTNRTVKLELPNGDQVDIPRKFEIDLEDNSVREWSGDLVVHLATIPSQG